MNKKNEIFATARQSIISQLITDDVDATQISDNTFAIPTTVDGETYYVKVNFSTADPNATKAREGFDLDVAVAKYQQELDERAERAAENAAKPKKSVKRERNSQFDGIVLDAINNLDAPITLTDFFNGNNFEGMSQQKCMEVLKFLGAQGAIKIIEGKPKQYFHTEGE